MDGFDVIFSYAGFRNPHLCFLRTLWLGRESPSSTLEAVGPDNFLYHSHCQAFLEPTKLASVSPPFIHRADPLGKAHIFCIFLHSPLKESLATFTRADPVVLAGGVVSAHCTRQGVFGGLWRCWARWCHGGGRWGRGAYTECGRWRWSQRNTVLCQRDRPRNNLKKLATHFVLRTFRIPTNHLLSGGHMGSSLSRSNVVST